MMLIGNKVILFTNVAPYNLPNLKRIVLKEMNTFKTKSKFRRILQSRNKV